MKDIDIIEIKGWLLELRKSIEERLKAFEELRKDIQKDIEFAQDIRNRWLAYADLKTQHIFSFPKDMCEVLDIVMVKLIRAIEGYELILKNIPNFIEDLERLQKSINKKEG
jgi:hypothetical protein